MQTAKAGPVLEGRGWTVQRKVVRLEQQPYKKLQTFQTRKQEKRIVRGRKCGTRAHSALQMYTQFRGDLLDPQRPPPSTFGLVMRLSKGYIYYHLRKMESSRQKLRHHDPAFAVQTSTPPTVKNVSTS
ncbi:hypothetical protein B0H19DRAFT_1055716 [Mycena capillaripes]|nr:hypothetical protein B0H19DRAFT_1055716 [Mycena capillaripes]